MKHPLTLIIPLALVLLFIACGKKEEKVTGQVTLTFWHTMNQEEMVTLDGLVGKFMEQNPQIEIQAQVVPFSDAQNKFKTMAQAGDAPDIFRAEIAWTPEFAELGFLVPLDDYVSEEDLGDYLPGALRYNQYKDRLWGIPQVTDCLALLYNKRMLAGAGVDPPATMDDLVRVAGTMTSPGKGRYGFFWRGDSYWLTPFIWAYGGGLIDEDDQQIHINDQGSVAGLNFYIALRDEYGVVPPEVDFANDYDNMLVGFKTGKYAMIINGPWATADILAGEQFSDPANLGVTRIPRGPAGYGSPVGGHNYVIASSCKDVPAAYEFIHFLNQAEHQALFAQKNNLLPTRRSAYDLPGVADNPIIQGFRYQLEVANNRPVIPEGGLLFVDFTPNLQAALNGNKTPQQALDATAEAWEELLRR
ncbi:extracellular solute-binding protein [bacterium]|nr:extracellular solute-binding protein [bacterium]